jgi:hypothetical protein
VTPNPTPTRAKSCPLCDGDADFLNVIPVYTLERFKEHAAKRHPGMDPRTLWNFPPSWKKAAG